MYCTLNAETETSKESHQNFQLGIHQKRTLGNKTSSRIYHVQRVLLTHPINQLFEGAENFPIVSSPRFRLPVNLYPRNRSTTSIIALIR